MNTSTSTARQPMTTLIAVRNDFRERREARRQHRALFRELATHTTRSEVGDLLALIDHQDSAEAEQIRSILMLNLQNNLDRRPLAS